MTHLRLILSNGKLEGNNYDLWDYINGSGRNEFNRWAEKLQKAQRAALNQRLDRLQQVGKDLMPELLAGPIIDHIYKIKLTIGGTQLRPLLCPGPIDNNKEFTLLAGATERDWVLKPNGVEQKAVERRLKIIDDPERRVKHVRLTK